MSRVRQFRFGIQVSRAGSRAEWVQRARQAEDLGYSTLFMPDHFTDQLAPVPALMAAAGATTGLRVGTLVLDNDYKHPVVLAKEAATLDLLSDGRLELGIGAGWMKTDYDESGIAYDPPAVRVDRMQEGLRVLKGCFGDGSFSFSGNHYTISGYDGQPKPVQKPHPPILIGGGGRRVLGIAAREADIVGINPNLKAGAITPDAARDATAASVARKLQWVRETAGERFDDIELNCLIFMAMVTDDRQATAENLAGMFGLTPEEALDIPMALVGTVDEIAETLEKRRAEFGFSYVVLQDGAMEALAPVVARLAGT